jgi:hypothetical protein
MTTQTLAPTLAAYIEANNARDPERFVACFAPDAVVHDESRTHRGKAGIRSWFVETSEAYSSILEPLGVMDEGGETVVTCKVTGNFDGSPIDLRFCFTLRDGLIAALEVRPG